MWLGDGIMNIPRWMIYGLLVWIAGAWLLKRMWWVLAILVIAAIYFMASDSSTAPQAIEQPSTIMQWFKDHTPKK